MDPKKTTVKKERTSSKTRYIPSRPDLCRKVVHGSERNSVSFLFHETGGIPTKQWSFPSCFVFREIIFCSKLGTLVYCRTATSSVSGGHFRKTVPGKDRDVPFVLKTTLKQLTFFLHQIVSLIFCNKYSLHQDHRILHIL